MVTEDIPAMPDDIRYLGDRIAAGAHDSSFWLKKLYDALIRQEIPNPTVINLNPGVIFGTTSRMRSYALVFSGGTANDVCGLKVGTAVAFDWVVPASPGVFTVPIPIVLDNGIDIQVVDVTTPGATNFRARVFAYVETDEI